MHAQLTSPVQTVTPSWLLWLLHRFYVARAAAGALISVGVSRALLDQALADEYALGVAGAWPPSGEGLERLVEDDRDDYKEGFLAGIRVTLVAFGVLAVAVVAATLLTLPAGS